MRDTNQVEKYLKKQDPFSVKYYKKICQTAIKEAFHFHPETGTPQPMEAGCSG